MSWSIGHLCWISVCGRPVMIEHWKAGWTEFWFVVWDGHWSRYVIIIRRLWSWGYWCWICCGFFVGGWGTWIGDSCIDSGCGIFFVFVTGRDDAAVSNIVASFLSASRWSELADVVNSGEGCLSAFNNSLAATNILLFWDKIGAATSVGKTFAVAQILIPPVDGTKHL